MNQTRTNRKKAKNTSNTPNTTGPQGPKKPRSNSPEKIYYSIIAILLVVLVGIMVFIFMNRDTGVDLNADNGTTPDSEVLTDLDEEEEEEPESDEEDTEDDEDADSADSEEETEEEPADETDEEEAEEEDVEEDTDQPEEETETEEEPEEDVEEEPETDDSDYEVTEDAPLDESHAVNYGEGSSDRVAIADAVSSVTGLNQNDMITWRVGNNGPGRVFAVMSDSGRNSIYRVLLQYGDGQWHVTSVEELSAVPSEYR
ncbi:MAG: YrrS family protein [Alkalibacterium sp.]|nr:YrrS family protein [Alkalibacterium sp.]